MSQNENQKLYVKMRIFKGAELLLKPSGEVKNENELMTLVYDDVMWEKHKSNIKSMNVCKVQLESVLKVTGTDAKTKGEATEQVEKTTELFEKINTEVEAILAKEVAPLTPEQQRIKELEDRLLKLEGGGADSEKEAADALKKARAEYKKLHGEKGDDAWTVQELTEKNEAKKAELEEASKNQSK